MRKTKWLGIRSVLGALLASAVVSASAEADVTVERGASILVFPKVIVGKFVDTIIQISNISNDLVFARCFYIDAGLRDPQAPEHPVFNPPLCMETDFEIRLTRQQPTHWLVSTGRGVDPMDGCDSADPDAAPTCVSMPGGDRDLGGVGIDPGLVPPAGETFVGELKCVEVDASGSPIGGNHLKGEATIKEDGGGVSKYNAVGIEGTDLVGATGNDLRLDNRSGETSGQYNACPAALILNHFAEGAEDPVIGRRCAGEPLEACVEDVDCSIGAGPCVPSQVTTELTLVPCSQDIENQLAATVTLQFKIYNEYESAFSTSTRIQCWKNIELSEIGSTNVFTRSVLGSDVAQTRMTPADIDNGGVVGVAEEIRSLSAEMTRAAFNIHSEGNRFFGEEGDRVDHVVIPDVR